MRSSVCRKLTCAISDLLSILTTEWPHFGERAAHSVNSILSLYLQFYFAFWFRGQDYISDCTSPW